MLIPLDNTCGYWSATSWELVLSTRMALPGAADRKPIASVKERCFWVESASFVLRFSKGNAVYCSL